MVELVGQSNLQISLHDDHSEAYRIRRDGSGVFYINGFMQTGQIVSVTLMEKDPNHSDYIISGRQMEVGLLCSDTPDHILSRTPLSSYCHKPSFMINTDFYKTFLRSLAVGQSIGLMIDDDHTLHTFVNGVHAEVFRSPEFEGGKFWFMGNAAGRSRRIKVETFDKTDITSLRLICLRTCVVKNEEHTEDLKYGTAVKVRCYQECNDVSKLTKIWIKVDKSIHKNMDIEGQVRSKNLRIMPQDINPADFNRLVHDCIKERVSGQYSIIRILCVGPPDVGKTSLKYVLQGKAPPLKYHSTHVTDKTNRIHRASMVPTQPSSPSSISSPTSPDWVEFGFDQHVKQLSSIVAGKRHQSDTSSYSDKPSPEDSVTQVQDEGATPMGSGGDPPLEPRPLTPVDYVVIENNDKEQYQDQQSTEDDDLLFPSLRNATACRDVKKDSGKIFEHIFFTDCGGQPQFLEVLPAFIKGGTVVIIVMNLNEDIRKVPKFSFHVNNKDTSLNGNYSTLTTLEMIETIAHSIAAYKKDDLDISDPYYMIVATHIDKVKFGGMKGKIKEVDRILDRALVDTSSKCIELEELNRAIIFPINTLNDKEGMGEIIRERIKQKVAGKTILIPIRWHSFEMHILAYSEEKKRRILTLEECVEVASSKEICIPEDEVQDVLKHYSEVNTLLYFPNFLPDFVMIDPQVLLEIVSNMLKVSFVKASSLPLALPPGSQVRLKNKGVFTKEGLDVCTNSVLKSEAPPSFTINHVITLLLQINLMAKICENEYFMPSALQVCDEKTFIKLRQKYTNHFDPLILLPQSKLLPHGLFTSLSACLLNRQGFPRFKFMDNQQYRNVIVMLYESRNGGGGSVMLSHMKYWLEVCYSGDTPHDTYLIQNVIFDILPDVCKNLPYDHQKILFSFGFYCMLASKSKEHRKPHPCKVDSYQSRGAARFLAVTCTIDPSLTTSKQGHDTRKTSWLSVENPPADVDFDLLQSLPQPQLSNASSKTTEALFTTTVAAFPQQHQEQQATGSSNEDLYEKLVRSFAQLNGEINTWSSDIKEEYTKLASSIETERQRFIETNKQLQQVQELFAAVSSHEDELLIIRFKNFTGTVRNLWLNECSIHEESKNRFKALEELYQTKQNELETNLLQLISEITKEYDVLQQLVETEDPMIRARAATSMSVFNNSPAKYGGNDARKRLRIIENNIETRLKSRHPRVNEEMYNNVIELSEEYHKVAETHGGTIEVIAFIQEHCHQARQSSKHQSEDNSAPIEDAELLESVLELETKVSSTSRSNGGVDNAQTSSTSLPSSNSGAIQRLMDAEKQCELLQEELKQERLNHVRARKELEDIQAERNREIEKIWRISSKDIEVTEEELGRGGWGLIRVGIFRGQKVAVKQLYYNIVQQSTVEMFHREINTMAKLRHPNLVLFIGAVLDHSSGSPLLIMEKLDMSLKQVYEASLLTDNMGKLLILRDVAAALCYLHCHEAEIIHRDVSSNNVLLEHKAQGCHWKAKLSDFGSARITQNAYTKGVGTPVYSAPETIVSVLDTDIPPWTTKADVFSYGVLVCEVFCARFPDHSGFRQMHEELMNDYVAIGGLVGKCIKRDPTKRPTMMDIIKDLDNYYLN